MMEKFAARHMENDALERLIEAMEESRKSSGYTQHDFGRLVGILRDVTHIEGFSERFALGLEYEVLRRRCAIYAIKVDSEELSNPKQLILNYLFDGAKNLLEISIEMQSSETQIAHGMVQCSYSSSNKQQKVA